MTTTARYIDYMPVAELPEAVRNPKAHDEASLAASVSRFGYVDPIVIDERTGRIVSGHGRRNELMRREAAGESPPDGVDVAEDGTWRVPVTRGWSSRSDEEAEAFVIAANRISERGGWQHDQLAEVLADLRKSDLGLDGVGFDDDELEAILISAGTLGKQASSFLDGVAGDGVPPDPMKTAHDRLTGGDGVDLRLPMTAAERDETVLKLREIQRAVGTESLAATVLHLVRTWQPT